MQGSHNLIFMTMTDFFDGQQWLKSKYPKPNHPNHTNCFFVINKKIGHRKYKICNCNLKAYIYMYLFLSIKMNYTLFILHDYL